jgi:iron(III) transport system substrate-binding protein
MRLTWLALALMLFISSASAQTVFPAPDQTNPRSLTIYSSLDEDLAKPLLAAFQKQFPSIGLRYHDLQSLEIYERTIIESDRNSETADLLISSAMDLQVKLANDGYAQRFQDLGQAWPNWAKWRQSVFGLTFEPSVVVYHRPTFEAVDIPRNRSELGKLLVDGETDFFGKIGTYDIERSGLGYLFIARDTEHDRDLWKLVNNMGASGVKLYSSSSSILERVTDGRLALGYNILGSYAQNWADKNPELGIIFPEDHTVIMSRIALVPNAAKNPELGRAMLTFLMSQEGQTIMSNELKLPVIHPDVDGPNTANALREKYGSRLRPITIGPGLVAYLDQVKRARLIRRWNGALRGE